MGLLGWQRSRPARRRLSLEDRYYERGLYHYTKNRLDLALADLDAAIARAPRRAEYYAARGLMLLQGGWAADAEEDFARALKLDATQWLAHYGRAMRAYQDGDFQAAVDHFSRAQRIAPDRPEIYAHRAVAFHRAGNAEEAVRDMEYALTLFDTKDKRREQAGQWLAIFRKALPARSQPKR